MAAAFFWKNGMPKSMSPEIWKKKILSWFKGLFCSYQEVDSAEDKGEGVGVGVVSKVSRHWWAKHGSDSLPEEEKSEGVGELVQSEEVDEDDGGQADVRGNGESEGSTVDGERDEADEFVAEDGKDSADSQRDVVHPETVTCSVFSKSVWKRQLVVSDQSENDTTDGVGDSKCRQNLGSFDLGKSDLGRVEREEVERRVESDRGEKVGDSEKQEGWVHEKVEWQHVTDGPVSYKVVNVKSFGTLTWTCSFLRCCRKCRFRWSSH